MSEVGNKLADMKAQGEELRKQLAELVAAVEYNERGLTKYPGNPNMTRRLSEAKKQLDATKAKLLQLALQHEKAASGAGSRYRFPELAEAKKVAEFLSSGGAKAAQQAEMGTAEGAAAHFQGIEAPAPAPDFAGITKNLQTFLNGQGYSLAVDGVFGPRTKAALTAWQRSQGDMRVTGELDSATAARMEQIGIKTSEGASATQAGGEATPGAPTAGKTPAEAAATPTVTNDQLEEEIRREFPQFAPWLDHPEIGPILRRAAVGDETDPGGWSPQRLAGEIFKTSWWQNTSDTARLWEQKGLRDPASQHQDRNNRAAWVDRQAKTYGLSLHALEILQIADQSLKWGWDEAQLTSAVVAKAKEYLGSNGRLPIGAIQDQADSVKKTARGYLVPVSDATAQELALKVAEGTMNQQGLDAYFRGLAKERFPWLGAQIDAGFTPSMYFSSHQQTIAQVLEMSPDQIDLMDNRWRSVVDFTDDKGNRRAMTIGEAEDWARRQDDYKSTDAANAKGYRILTGLMSDMGQI